MSTHWVVLVAALAVGIGGCEGSLSRDDAGATGADGATAPRPDAGTPSTDSATPPADASTTTRPCSAACGETALCDATADRCVCIPGYAAAGADCVATPVSDPTSRGRDEVCNAWRTGRMSRGGPAFDNPSASACGPGSLPFAAHMEALSYLNTYRWLSGVGPVTLNVDPTVPQAQQECAVLQAANSDISHSPPMDWLCWTADGAAAAGGSYIAWGFASASATVDGYIRETQARLSHRRGLLPIGRANIYFGHFQNGGCCRYGGVGAGLASDPDYIFYPNAGFAPIELFGGKWSVMRGRGDVASFTARVFDDASGAEMPVATVESFDDFTSWTQTGWSPTDGVTYRVELTRADASMVVYRTTPTSCL